MQVDFVRRTSIRVSGNPSRNGASSEERDEAHEPDGVGHSITSLERRLDALEATLFERLPRRLGEEIRAALDDREEARIERLDDAIARLLDALGAVDASTNGSNADGAEPTRRRRSRAAI